MSPFDALAGSVISSVQGVYGSSSSSAVFTYSRAFNGVLAVDPFPLAAALNAGGEFASPTGGLAGALFVRLSDIPLGPKKGDQVLIAHTPPAAVDGTYRVQEIFLDKAVGWANLELRLMPAP